MATLTVDPEFNIHTSYHNDFFLLRTRVLVNGENTEIRSITEGMYQGPVLNFGHSGNTISTTLSSISIAVSPVLVHYGIYHVDTFYYEQCPLFHVVFSSESCLKNFLLAIKEVKCTLEAELQSLFLKSVPGTESAQQLTVEVQPNLFLVSPNQQETKGAECHSVTTENCSNFVTRWKESKLFEFGTLYQGEAKPPIVISEPTSQKDIVPGRSIAFSVQATGTKPLSYQWQWKQFGKEGEQDEWQNLPSDSGTFQVVEVQACNAGYYRCVVSNCAGSETSQCASLTVAAELVDLMSELQDVNDWVPFGLYLGIKMPRLEAIEVDCPTLSERRTKMLNEWQKNVTPTWSAVVQALVGIGMRRLAAELAQKHGTLPPKLTDSDLLDQLENILQQKEEAAACKLHEELQKHILGLKQDHKKLMDVDKHLTHAQWSKAKSRDKASEDMTKLQKLHGNVEKLTQEKSILEMELNIKERECQLLCSMQEKDAYNQDLQKRIDKKRKKIKSLKQELQKKECEFQSALQEVQTKQEALLQSQEELKKQHEKVMQLQREKENLDCLYNIEKEQVSKIVKILVSDKEEMQQQLTSMKYESELKSQQIKACNSDINRLSKEAVALSSSLEEKEAAAAQLQNELQKRQQVVSTQLLVFIKLRAQIAEVELRLQEVEYQKQQAELEVEAAVQEMEARRNLEAQLHAQLDEPPKVTCQPTSLCKVFPGRIVSFSVQATGSRPLSYHWQWKSAEEEGSSEKWQPCDAEWCDGATLTIPSVQKSNEGSYRCVVSNCVGNEISNPAKVEMYPPDDLQLPLQLRWRRCQGMTHGMTYYPYSAVLQRMVYVGGGNADKGIDACTVLKYDIDKDVWSSLPRYQCKWFAMTIIDCHLTVVGGDEIDTKCATERLAAFDPMSQEWTNPYPPMPTPRSHPVVLTYDMWLLVASGRDGWTNLDTVELLNMTTNQWLSASPLPIQCSLMTSTVLQHNWYIITYQKEVLCASLSDIVSQTVSQSLTNNPSTPWCHLPHIPLNKSTAIAFRGSLLVVGGNYDSNSTPSTAIYLYQPESGKWIKVGELPTPRTYCSCIPLSSGELMVVGGHDNSERSCRVDVAAVLP